MGRYRANFASTVFRRTSRMNIDKLTTRRFNTIRFSNNLKSGRHVLKKQ